jgi:hypothetical protein
MRAFMGKGDRMGWFIELIKVDITSSLLIALGRIHEENMGLRGGGTTYKLWREIPDVESS